MNIPMVCETCEHWKFNSLEPTLGTGVCSRRARNTYKNTYCNQWEGGIRSPLIEEKTK